MDDQVNLAVATADRAAETVRRWLRQFNEAIDTGNAELLTRLFLADSHWRNVCGVGWSFNTISGRDDIVASLVRAAEESRSRHFEIDPDRAAPSVGPGDGFEVAEAFLRFTTDVGIGAAHLRLKLDGEGARDQVSPAWTFLTAIESLTGYDEATEHARTEEDPLERDWAGPNWADLRRQRQRYADRDPAVLIVGGGHAGLAAAASLKALGVEALIVDRVARIGDNWRLRYNGLKLHSPTPGIHLPYLPFPSTWPKYIPKDKIANWFELYVEALELDFWTSTTFEGAQYDAKLGCWTASLRLADGSLRQMKPRHIIMATSISGTPNIPSMPTFDRFKGTVMHSSQFGSGADWKGRKALVFGTGTSGHDVAQDLHVNGASVTMVQRGPTIIVSVGPSAHVYLDDLYAGTGPSLRDRDLIACSYPFRVMKKAHQYMTANISRPMDKELHERLEKVGFRLHYGEDGSGWPLSYFNHRGGYYFNVGASDLIADGAIDLVQYDDIAAFEATGARLKSGALLDADLVVLATGYKGYEDLVTRLFGTAVADRVGRVWGYDKTSQELSNMWMPTEQPGLWFVGGSFTQSRIYSKYLAIQIKAIETGLHPV